MEAITCRGTRTGRGSVPGGWWHWAETALAPPVVSWQQVLGAAVRRAVADTLGHGRCVASGSTGGSQFGYVQAPCV